MHDLVNSWSNVSNQCLSRSSVVVHHKRSVWHLRRDCLLEVGISLFIESFHTIWWWWLWQLVRCVTPHSSPTRGALASVAIFNISQESSVYRVLPFEADFHEIWPNWLIPPWGEPWEPEWRKVMWLENPSFQTWTWEMSKLLRFSVQLDKRSCNICWFKQINWTFLVKVITLVLNHFCGLAPTLNLCLTRMVERLAKAMEESRPQGQFSGCPDSSHHRWTSILTIFFMEPQTSRTNLIFSEGWFGGLVHSGADICVSSFGFWQQSTEMASFAAFSDGAEVMQRALEVSPASKICSEPLETTYETDRCLKWIQRNKFERVSIYYAMKAWIQTDFLVAHLSGSKWPQLWLLSGCITISCGAPVWRCTNCSHSGKQIFGQCIHPWRHILRQVWLQDAWKQPRDIWSGATPQVRQFHCRKNIKASWGTDQIARWTWPARLLFPELTVLGCEEYLTSCSCVVDDVELVDGSGSVFVRSWLMFLCSCCVDVVAAEHHSADCVIHFGRACLSQCERLPVLYVFTRLPLDVLNCRDEVNKIVSDPSTPLLLIFDVRYNHVAGEHILRVCGDVHAWSPMRFTFSNIFWWTSYSVALALVKSHLCYVIWYASRRGAMPLQEALQCMTMVFASL